MDGFATLGEAARITTTPRPNGNGHAMHDQPTRGRQTVPWGEFEPLLNQLRNTLDLPDGKICLAMGYSGSSLFAEWRRSGVPTVALRAARDLLASSGGRYEPRVITKRQFSRDELADILGLVARLPVTEPRVANTIARLANEINVA